MSGLLVAIDVDGTLIGEDLKIADVDAAAVRRAIEAGMMVSLATGRLFEAALPFADVLRVTAPVIALNGASIFGPQQPGQPPGEFTLLHAVPLERSVALEAFDALKEHGFHVQLYYDDRLYLDALNDGARLYLRISRVQPVMVKDLRLLLTDEVPAQVGPMKVLAVGEPDDVVAQISRLAARLGSRANVFRSQPPFLEVTSPQANKGAALCWIAGRNGLTRAQTAAIGDSDNDVPMFGTAGRSFAMASGTPGARAAASRIVAAQNAGGVAEALSILLHEPADARP